MATLAALVLGLLIASAKVSFDRLNDEFTQTAATVIMIDRTLADYGPDAKEARELPRHTYASALDLFYSGRGTGTANVDVPESLAHVEQFQQKLRELTPRNDMQRMLQSETLARSHDMAQTRWILFRPGQGAIPTPFLAVLVLWLGILFAGFGLVSANNRTAIATLFVCALSVSGAIFLIEDIAHPLEGLMQISRTPAQIALSHLGQ
jgi:pyridoxal biosynthesis lyase PdxS